MPFYTSLSLTPIPEAGISYTRLRYYRQVSPVILYTDGAVKELRLEDIKAINKGEIILLEKSKGWITLIFKGTYTGRGIWAPEIEWLTELNEKYVVFSGESWSNGGKRGEQLVILTLDTKKLPEKQSLYLGKLKVPHTEEVVGKYLVLYSKYGLLTGWHAELEEELKNKGLIIY